ncbi:MAG: DUF4340 domain-containing protein [Verrucomicrobia bacterium]|nr:MAG: DUF4340 domain-containing protein [Verrucomicrobiota bacterium]TAE89253.1 MAG: DUF4340 domain-containing protein [Verrucomicrobiota bacterium]TAF27873.1 MAG: DUF4340 domain-containing protein [Verrucomicrobiota bacterium]TAF42722.1 MAG: DUF4340 domain-containing protein [Verrucomicrobiota bacterium]
MRSIPFTLFLLLLTIGLSLTAALRMMDGSLDRLLGPPATAAGSPLYRFATKDIHRIRLSGNGVQADCVFENGNWRILEPWQDRMDPRAADAILQFTLGTRVEEVIPTHKIDNAKAGLREGTIGISIENRDGKELARYLLGRRTQWIQRDPRSGEETPTVFIQPREDGREDFTYACTGDIHPIFRDGLRHLRDHHPFLFNPFALSSIRIQGSEGELLLSRSDPKAPWRITKPLELRTDPAAVKKLIEDLFKLRALKVAERADLTLPADELKGGQKIAIRHFGQETEVVLDVLPPSVAGADTVFATISDRPGTVFELPLKPIAPGLPATDNPDSVASAATDDGMVSLAGLPDSVNELRNPMLTNIDVESLQGILITPATGPEILVAREKGGTWEFRDGNRMKPLNELSLFRLLKALTQTKVAAFVSDAAMNLSPYGLDRPALAIGFTSFGNEGFKLLFGQARDGTWHAMRQGVPTVVKLDDGFIREISTHSWQWRHPSIWSIPAVDLAGMIRTMEGRPPLELEYNLLADSWKARENGSDRSSELVTERANRLVKLLVDLQGESWLAPDDDAARKALAQPALSFSLAVMGYDAKGERAGIVRRTLNLAPATDRPDNTVFYGRIDRDPAAFILSSETVRLLAVDLFGDD